MQIVTQLALLPSSEPISWMMLPKEVWEHEAADTVHRSTEDEAFQFILKEARFYASRRVLSLTPLHRRVQTLEAELMVRYPHYQPPDVERGIAERLHISVLRVKRILLDTTLIYGLAIAAGMDWILDAA